MTEKEKKRLEMYEQRYAESWKKREINEEGTLKPFSKEELEHIFMLNDHLKELTSSTIDKTLRVSIHLLDEIEKGYKDFEDYQIESYIGMTYLDDSDETLEEQIRLTFEMAKCDIIGWGADLEPGVQEDDAFDKEMIFNNEENSIGQLWNEIWEQYHVSLNWAFSHYFNYLSIFTVEDIMKIKPGNFEMSIEISL